MKKVENVTFVGDDDNIIRKGECVIHDVTMRYSLKPQSQGRYALRGSISIIDPASGRVMQRKKADDKSKMGEIRKEINTNASNVDDIKEIIAKKAKKLYEENEINIKGAQRQRTIVDESELRILVVLYAPAFLAAKPSRSERAQAEWKRKLDKMAKLFRNKGKICNITEKQRKEVKKELGENWKEYFVATKNFLHYLYQHYTHHTVTNPFETADLDSGNIKVVSGRVAPELLSVKENQDMNLLIRDNLANGAYMGLALVKEGGYSAEEACALKWSDIEFDQSHNQGVFVHLSKESQAGATHDYTAPLFAVGARLLRERWVFLLQNYSEVEVRRMPIASAPDDPTQPLLPEVLKAVCQSAVKQCSNGEAAEGDAGISIILRGYHARLLAIFHDDDDGAVQFLRHNRLTSVQADHYRSLVEKSARHYLRTMMHRDPEEWEEMPLDLASRIMRDVGDFDPNWERIELPAPPKGHCLRARVPLTNLASGDQLTIKGQGICDYMFTPCQSNNTN